MEYVTTRGMQMPALGFGTWQLSGQTCRSAVRSALEIGYRHIDTARAYGNEAEIGEVLEESSVARHELFLTTKLWHDELDADSVGPAIADSLERLRTDYVDLALIHWPSDQVPLAETLSALSAERESGRICHVGVSNFPPGLMLEALSETSIVCNQCELHPLLDQTELLQVASMHEVAITAYCPLARGKVFDVDRLAAIGARHGKSAAQVTLRYLLDLGNVAAVPKAANREHAADNFDIFDFALSPEEQAEIARLSGHQRLIDPDFAPDWRK